MGAHATVGHQCPIEGRRAGRGRPCPHGVAKCANCGWVYGARTDACAAKREARQLAKGWKTPLPSRRERGAKAPGAPEVETPAAQDTEERGEMEVEKGLEAAPEEMEEEGGRGGVEQSGFLFLFLFIFI